MTAIYIFQLGLFVDEDGERFLDEGEDFRDQTYVKFSKAIMAHKSGVAFNVFDNKPRAEDPEAWKRAIRTEESALEALTLRDLAARIKVPGDHLERTIEAYNAACQAGNFDPLTLDGLATHGLTPNKNQLGTAARHATLSCLPRDRGYYLRSPSAASNPTPRPKSSTLRAASSLASMSLVSLWASCITITIWARHRCYEELCLGGLPAEKLLNRPPHSTATLTDSPHSA